MLFERLGQPSVIGEIAAGIALGPTLLGAAARRPVERPVPGRRAGGPAADRPTRARAVHVRRRLGPRPADRRAAESARPPLSRSPRSSSRSRSGSRSPPTCTRHTTSVAGAGGAVLAVRAVRRRLAVADGLPGPRAHPAGDRPCEDAARSAACSRAAAVDDVVGWSVLAIALGVLASSGCVGLRADPGRDRAVHRADRWLSSGPLLQVLLLQRVAAPRGRSRSRGIRGRLRDGRDRHPRRVRRIPHRRSDATTRARRGTHRAGPSLAPVVALLAPIYFVTVRDGGGHPWHCDPVILPTSALILAAACAGKFLGAFAGARVAGIAVRDSAAVGILMNTRGVIEIVLLTVGQGRRPDRRPPLTHNSR